MSNVEPPRRAPARELFTGMLLVVAVGAVIVFAAWAMRKSTREAALRSPAPLAAQGEILPPAPRAPAQHLPGAVKMNAPWDAAAFQQVRNLIEVEHRRNVAAITTARLRLEEKFRRYSERVPEFTDALNTLPEKARLARTLVEDQAQADNETQQEAAKLFEEKVAPLDRLRSDVEEVVTQFERDVKANRRIVAEAAGPALALPDLPLAPAAGSLDLLLADYTGQLGRFLGSQAGDVPMSSLNSLTKSVAVEEAMRRKVTAAMESHDSEARRATVVGTAAGVLAGAADYWLMQSHFETALTRRCQDALDKIRTALWADPQTGLEASFASYVDLVRDAQLLALKRASGK